MAGEWCQNPFWRAIPFSGKKRLDSVMGRARRVDVGGMIYHVLNRANFRPRLFRETAHYEDFRDIVEVSQGKKEIENI